MLTRIATVGVLVLALVLVGVLVLGGDSGHKYKLIFQTGGQLVNGNQVLVGGAVFGTVSSIKLTDNNQAEVEINVDETIHKGTTAVIRATSLSGVANRYIALSLGPSDAAELPDGSVLNEDSTTTAVDLDQLFDTFGVKTRAGLSNVIKGFARSYVGVGPQANETYKYFGAQLSSTDRLLKQLNRDQFAFSQFIVNGSKTVTAIASRRADLTSAVSNAGTALGAIASENTAFSQTLQDLPPTLRQANTTFVNLRATLDDLDPLVNTAKVQTENLTPFLKDLQPVTSEAVPVFKDLRLAVDRPGAHNDLADTTVDLVNLHKLGSASTKASIDAMNASEDFVAFARPYSPDILQAFGKLAGVAGYFDANGNYARVQASAFNLFKWNSVTGNLEPIPVSDKFNGFTTDTNSNRCPGGSTQPITGSNPFLDEGKLGAGDCDPSNVPPGP